MRLSPAGPGSESRPGRHFSLFKYRDICVGRKVSIDFGKKSYISMSLSFNLVMRLSVVTVSPKFQVVIPVEVREKMNLKPGQKVIIILKDGVVHLFPEKSFKEMRGFVKGVTTENLREEEDRF
jgi:AbrB family looped-hinge helix DNA binding protein